MTGARLGQTVAETGHLQFAADKIRRPLAGPKRAKAAGRPAVTVHAPGPNRVLESFQIKGTEITAFKQISDQFARRWLDFYTCCFWISFTQFSCS